MDLRQGKKGRYFEKLVDDFDRERNLITFYKTKFYTYEISKLADHVSVFQIEKNEIADILNYLYLRTKKKKRIITREGLFSEF